LGETGTLRPGLAAGWCAAAKGRKAGWAAESALWRHSRGL